jgi:hypothetical protein
MFEKSNGFQLQMLSQASQRQTNNMSRKIYNHFSNIKLMKIKNKNVLKCFNKDIQYLGQKKVIDKCEF